MSDFRSDKKRSLFEMVLKASPFAAFAFHPENVEEESEGWIENPNIKMRAYLEKSKTGDLRQVVLSSLSFNHPAVFPLKVEDKDKFAVFMPLIDDPTDNIRICFIINNSQNKSFEPPLLTEESWHELNNPLAIISLTLQKALRKEILDQEDIDTILGRVNSTFLRIESYITEEID